MNKLSPQWALRLGLGVMYLYSGYDLFVHPAGWVWAVPVFLKNIISSLVSITAYLKFQGVLEIAIAIILLLPFIPQIILKLAVVVSVLEMAAILIFTGIDAITFRDIGLIGNGLALYLLLIQKKT